MISRKYPGPGLIAWRYVPAEKTFARLLEAEISTLLSTDFEKHPITTRRRTHGTSVYLRLNFAEHPSCNDWLRGSALWRLVRRDCILLPATVFVADYSLEGKEQPILNGLDRDVRDIPLTLNIAPWDVEGLERQDSAADSSKAATQLLAVLFLK